MKKIFLFIVFLSFFFGLKAQNKKVVGFLPHYRFQHTDQINFKSITHLNLAFANPDMEGNLSFENAPIAYTINQAKASDVKVFISLAGGYLTSEWEAAWNHLMKEANRSDFIHKIVKYVKYNDCDGVDMDLEWQFVTDLYSPFVDDLIDSLHAHGLECSASLPGTYRYPEITDNTLQKLDWVNMMVYDLRGPWDPGNPGPHSPFSFAENSLYYWKGEGMTNDRLTLGMPFYGYDFGTSNVSAYTYRYIVSLDENNAYQDQVDEIYYNGINTIKAKTQFAIDEDLLGVMMWELGQDSYTELSLLQAIDEVINSQATFTFEEEAIDIRIYPNPVQSELFISSDKECIYQLFDLQGRIVSMDLTKNTKHQIFTFELPKGLYHLRIQTDSGIIVKSIAKQ